MSEPFDQIGLNNEAPPFAPDTPEVRIASGSALSLVARVVGMGTSFLIGVLVARLFGVTGKGMLAIVIQVPSLLVLVLDLGIGTSTVYFVSSGRLRAGAAAANAALLAIVLGAAGAPLIYLLLIGRFAIAPGVPLAAALLAIAIVPTGLFSGWISSVSMGLSNLSLPLRSSIASSVTTVLGLGALVLFGYRDISAVVAASVAGTVAGIVVFLVGLRSHLVPFRPDTRDLPTLARFSAKVHLSGIAGYLHERQDILLLGWLSGTAAVGLYSVGVSFAEIVWYVPSALSIAILAKGSRRDEVSAADYTARTSRVAIVFMLATILVSLVAAPLIIPAVYGRAFASAMYPFFALLPGVLSDGVTRILWSYQITRGRTYWQLAVGTMLANLAAVALIVPRFGAVGAAIASSVSYTLLAVLTIRHFCLDTGTKVADVLVPHRADVHTILKAAGSMAEGILGRTKRGDRA